jgi:DNA-binding NtrC family response regulator
MISQKIPDMKRSILIVDDERLIRWSLHEKLARAGYEVLEAQNAREMLGHIAAGSQSIDLVLLDLKLPDGDGLALLKIVREKLPHCAVIMMSAHGSDASVAEAISSGAAYFVHKPFKFDDVLRLVGHTLAGCA